MGFPWLEGLQGGVPVAGGAAGWDCPSQGREPGGHSPRAPLLPCAARGSAQSPTLIPSRAFPHRRTSPLLLQRFSCPGCCWPSPGSPRCFVQGEPLPLGSVCSCGAAGSAQRCPGRVNAPGAGPVSPAGPPSPGQLPGAGAVQGRGRGRWRSRVQGRTLRSPGRDYCAGGFGGDGQ